MRVRIASVAALLAWGVAACISDHVATQPASRDVAAICANPDTPPADVIVIKNFAFHPTTLNVGAGETVTWVNCETNSTSHTSTSDAGVWASGLIAPSTTFDHNFATAGSFPFHCEPHPFMTGTVVVQ